MKYNTQNDLKNKEYNMLNHKNEFINKEIPKNVIIYGGTGQSLQSKPIIESYGSRVIAIIDDTPNLRSPFPNIPIFYGYENFMKYYKTKKFSKVGFCIAIGNPNGYIRVCLHDTLKKDGFVPISIAHQTAWINEDTIIGDGIQVMAKAIICAKVNIGKECIISTAASIGHECILHDGVEIGPNSTLGGIVEIGFNTWTGMGSIILPRLKIGRNVLVGAGAVVTRDVPDGMTVFGNPARPLIKRGL